MRKNILQKVFISGIFLVLILVLFNLFTIFNLKTELEGKLIEIQELLKPAKLELIVIKPDCADCFDIDSIVNNLKSLETINITSENVLTASSTEAKELINKYGIEKVPTVVLKGDVNKTSIQNFKQVNDALVFDGITPPYIDVQTGEVVGRVLGIIIFDDRCDVCDSFDSIVQVLNQSGVVFSKIEKINIDLPRAQEFISRYGIKRISSLFLSKDIEEYPIARNLRQIGFRVDDGYIIESSVPYVETNTSRIRGLVNLIILNDSSCTECYDVTVHKPIIARFGVFINEEKILDASSDEGKELIEKYNITKIPTIILSGDLAIYTIFNDVWKQVGTIEEDGSYVFRNLDIMGPYKDLITGNVVVPTHSQVGQTSQTESGIK